MVTTGSQEPELENAHDSTQVSSGHPLRSGVGFMRWVIVAIVCLALGGIIYAGIRSRTRAETSLEHVAHTSETASVTVVHPQAGSKADMLMIPGNTQPYIDTPIYARTSGYLQAWYADIGAHVKKGQLLALIDAPELDQQLAQARADVKNAQANLQLARITAARMQNLIKTSAVSQQDTDTAVSELASREAVLASGQANVARLEQLQAYERVVAPFDGVITARNTDFGDLIQAGDPSTSKELFHLASISRLRVFIAVPEVDARDVKTGEKVSLTVDTYPGKLFTGTVVRDSDSIDPVSRTLNVEVDVNNPDSLLMPGAYASVRIPVPATPGAVTIPSNTLIFRSQGMQVGIVRNGRVQLAPITIGHDYGSSVEVVSGLNPEDEVILNPSDSLESGVRVHVLNAQNGNTQNDNTQDSDAPNVNAPKAKGAQQRQTP